MSTDVNMDAPTPWEDMSARVPLTSILMRMDSPVRVRYFIIFDNHNCRREILEQNIIDVRDAFIKMCNCMRFRKNNKVVNFFYK